MFQNNVGAVSEAVARLSQADGEAAQTKPGDGFLVTDGAYIILKAIFCLKTRDGCDIALLSAGCVYNSNSLIFPSHVSIS